MERAVSIIIYFGFALLVALLCGRIVTALVQYSLGENRNRLARILFFKIFDGGKPHIYLSLSGVKSHGLKSVLAAAIGFRSVNVSPGSFPDSDTDELLSGRTWQQRLRRLIPVLFGLGMIILPYYAYEVAFAIAYALIITATLLGLCFGEVSAGPRWIWIPLVVLLILGLVFSKSPPPTGLLLIWLFGIYLVGGKLGTKVTRYFGWATAANCLGMIVYGIIYGFSRTGGWFAQYNTATAAILVGFLLWESPVKWRISPLVLVALFFTGADEAILAIAIIFIVMLIRRDWSKKLLLPVGALALTLAVCTPLGITGVLWGHLDMRTEAAVASMESPNPESLAVATGSRWDIYRKAAQEIGFFGHGYDPFNDYWTSIHNVPLRVAHELGIPGAVAWMVTYFYALKKSKAKYALVAMGALCLADHMFWTNMPAYYWLGLAVAASAGPDLIFRKIRPYPRCQKEVETG